MSSPRLSIIPGWIVCDPRLKGKDLQVLCLLGRHANTRHGWCRRSQVRLAQELECARSSVQASIDRLVTIGVVERRRVESANGRDSAHWYRVIYDSVVPEAAFEEFDAEDAAEFGDDGGDFAHTPPAGMPAPPAGISAPPAGPESAPPAGSGPAPINASPLTPPAEREREGAPARADQTVDRSTLPGTAEFRKRLQRFLSGDGYRGGEWPNWAKATTIQYISRHFERLSEEDRQAAERHRDAYLAKAGKQAMGAGNYFRDHAWESLSERDIARASQQSAGRVDASAPPENWATAYGPLHAAMFFRLLMAGPDKPDFAPENGIWFSGHMQRAWPSLMGFWQQTDLRGGVKATADDAALAARMEFVPIDSARMLDWRRELKQRGLPDLRMKEGMRGLYFPAGGPEAWDEFEREAFGHGRDDQAAE